MGTPSPLHENRNPAPGKHSKPGSDWRVVALVILNQFYLCCNRKLFSLELVS